MRSSAWPNSATLIIDGSELREQGGKGGKKAGGVLFLSEWPPYRVVNKEVYVTDKLSMNLHFHVVRGRLPIGVSDGEGVGGGPLGRDPETPRVRWPNFRHRRIEADGLRVDDVIADLCGLPAPDNRGISVKSADAEPWATELLDGELIFCVMLLV